MSAEQSTVGAHPPAEGKNTATGLSIAKPEAAPPAPPSNKWLALPRKHGLFLLIACLALFLMSINLTQPWGSANEDNGFAFSSIGVNYIRFGFGPGKGQNLADAEALNGNGPVSIPGVPPSQEFQYLLTGPVHPYVYADHPPLFGLTVAGALELFGYDFWVVRLVPLAYSLATLFLFYVLMIYLFDRGTAQIASFLYATFPMMAYFGRNVAHEAPTLFWATVLLIGYVRWRSTQKPRRWLLLIATAIVIGGLYGWPMYYFAFILFGIDWLATRHFDRTLALATLVPAVLTFGLVFAQIFWALGGRLQPIIDVFLLRSVANGYAPGPNTTPNNIISWLVRMAHNNRDGFSLWSTLALPFVLFFVAKRAKIEGWSLRVRILVITFLFGLSHILIFHGGAYFHIYWQFYFLPFYAMSIGWAGTSLIREHIPSAKLRAATLLYCAICILYLSWPFIRSLYTYRTGVLVLPFGL